MGVILRGWGRLGSDREGHPEEEGAGGGRVRKGHNETDTGGGLYEVRRLGDPGRPDRGSVKDERVEKDGTTSVSRREGRARVSRETNPEKLRENEQRKQVISMNSYRLSR